MIFNSLMKQLQKTLETWKLIRELRQLDERELNDLGISRYDIPQVAKGTLHPYSSR